MPGAHWKTAERRRRGLGELAPLLKLQGLLAQLAEKRSRLPAERLRLDQVTEAVRTGLMPLVWRWSKNRRKLGDLELLLKRQGLLRQLVAAQQRSGASCSTTSCGAAEPRRSARPLARRPMTGWRRWETSMR